MSGVSPTYCFAISKGLLDGVDGAREEHVLRELAVKARHEDVAGLLDRARDGVGLVRADLEVGFKLGLDGGRSLEAAESLLEHLGARAFLAVGEQDHDAVLPDGAGGVLHGLLHLVDVDVLGIAAAGDDHHVGELRNDAAVDLVDELAGFLVRGDVVAREHAQELVLGVQDGVEEEERAALGEERDALHLVLVARGCPSCGRARRFRRA